MARKQTRKSTRTTTKGSAKSMKSTTDLSAVIQSAMAKSSDRGLTAFGERLVMTLQSKGMSDSELAKALGIAQPNIHTLKYKTDRPRHKTVVKIAKVLGVTPEALLPQTMNVGVASQTEGTKVYLVIENRDGRQTIRLA